MFKAILKGRNDARYADSTLASRAEQGAIEARLPTTGPRGKLGHLPWPEWFDQAPRTARALHGLSLAAFGLLGLWGSATTVLREPSNIEAYGVGIIAAFLLSFLPLLHRVRTRRRVRRTWGVRTSSLGSYGSGLLLPYARGLNLVSWIGVVISSLAAGVMVLVIPFSSVGGYRQEAAGPLGVCAAAGVLWWAFTLLRTGRRKRGLLLTADGVVFYGTRGRYDARWDQIAEVNPEGGLPDQPHEGIVVRIHRLAGASTSLGDGQDLPFEWLIRRDLLGIDPVLTNQILNFYLENPVARGELGGPAAIQRLKKADVPAYLQPSVLNAEQRRRWMETR